MAGHLFDLIQSASAAPAQFVITGLWQGVLLTTGAALFLRLAPKIGASTRFKLWMTVFLVVAALPWLGVARGWPAALPEWAAHPAAAAGAGSAWQLNAGWAAAIDCFWILASLISLAALLADAGQLRALAASSECIPLEALSSELRSVLAPARGRRARLCLSDEVDVPSAIGFFDPAILLPRRLWASLTPAEALQIVTHEMAHLSRGDDWSNLLQRVVRALFPLNPALFWVDRRLCLERERACDQSVLDAAISPRAYASCLTKIAESRLRRPSPALAPGAWKRRSELAWRVHRILEPRRALSPLRSRAVAATALSVFLGAALALARSPQLVSFTSPGASAGGPAAAASAAPGGQVSPAGPTASLFDARYQAASLRLPATAPRRMVRPAAHPAALRSRNLPGETVIVFTLWRPSPELLVFTNGTAGTDTAGNGSARNGAVARSMLLYRFYVIQI